MPNIPTGTSLNGHNVTYWNRQTEADGEIMSLNTIMPMCSAIQENRDDIDTMKAATDVINVYNSFADFSANSGSLTAEGYLTDYDIIKILNDETRDVSQTYYQCHKEDEEWYWYFIGSLDPYYSKSDINAFSASLSGTISSTYLSANDTAVIQGKNIALTFDENNPYVTIATQDDVSFNSVTAATASGQSAKFTNISGNDVSVTNLSATNLSANDISVTNKISAKSALVLSASISSLSSNEISASTVSSNLSGLAKEAVNTQDTLTSYYFTESQQGTNTATYNVSSFKISGNRSGGIELSQTTNSNNEKFLYLSLNSAKVCDIIEDSNRYVKYVDTELTIGNVPTLNASTMATALGSYATASNYSFAVNFGEENSKKSVVDNKGVSIGDSNSATYNTFVIGHSNSAEGSNAGQDRFVMGIANKVGDSVSVDYILGNQNTANANNSYIVGLQNNVKSLVNKPTFVMGWGNEIDKSTNKYNFVLGGYAKVEEVSDKFFVIGNGTSNTAKHNAFELSDLKMSFIAPDIRTDVGQYGIDITFLGSVTGGEDINYGFIPYRESTLCESETIYTSSISSRQYLFWLSDDINVQGNLTITEPSSTKSTHFRFRKYEIFGNDWTLYLNIHKDYNIRMMGCPGSGTSGNPLDITARWISGYSNSDSNTGSMTGEYSGYINQYYIIKDPEDRYKYSSFICKSLHPYSYVDVDIDATLKIVTLIKGGLGAM